MTRVENVNITRGLIVGSRAKKLPTTTPSDATHEWSVYIKSAFNTPMDYIRHVSFKLHETFANPLIIKEYPFEITEKGWGEFTIQLKIVFIDFNERPVNLTHYLVLHEGEKDGYVVSEKYEEIVFRSPSSLMYKILKANEDVKDEEFLRMEKEEGDAIDSAIIMMLERFDEA